MKSIDEGKIELVRKRQAPQIGEILVNKHGLDADSVAQVLRHSKTSKQSFGETAVRLKLVTAAAVDEALAEQFSASYISPESDSKLDRELVTLFNPNSEKTHNLRALRTRLSLQSESLSFAVTSGKSGEGCSFIAANLAVSFAQIGKKTILIDANVHDPRQHEMFALERTSGLTELVSPRESAGQHTVNIPSLSALSVMTSGAMPPNAEELLCSARGARLIEMLKSQFEVVIVDTPSASVSSMQEWYANQLGQTLLVVQKHKSRWRETQRLAQRLGAHSNVLGVALTHHK